MFIYRSVFSVESAIHHARAKGYQQVLGYGRIDWDGFAWVFEQPARLVECRALFERIAKDDPGDVERYYRSFAGRTADGESLGSLAGIIGIET